MGLKYQSASWTAAGSAKKKKKRVTATTAVWPGAFEETRKRRRRRSAVDGRVKKLVGSFLTRPTRFLHAVWGKPGKPRPGFTWLPPNLSAPTQDTGSNTLVVRRSLVPEAALTGITATLLLVDGRSIEVPKAEVDITSPYFTDVIVGNVPFSRNVSSPDTHCEMPAGASRTRGGNPMNDKKTASRTHFDPGRSKCHWATPKGTHRRHWRHAGDQKNPDKKRIKLCRPAGRK
ncbi:hypothetical protein HPB47_014454 [Ixodes persulcatus]|uniref:Uncharacterized protein n=1 Tax=Ixodes persulcatus TaxID=34615 RepID=A0AC60QVX8_IXOPE|nr:hypothetical protein HPB47_014454 [Ixodes persulcatus]